jgi:hypothetical protein
VTFSLFHLAVALVVAGTVAWRLARAANDDDNEAAAADGYDRGYADACLSVGPAAPFAPASAVAGGRDPRRAAPPRRRRPRLRTR